MNSTNNAQILDNHNDSNHNETIELNKREKKSQRKEVKKKLLLENKLTKNSLNDGYIISPIKSSNIEESELSLKKIEKEDNLYIKLDNIPKNNHDGSIKEKYSHKNKRTQNNGSLNLTNNISNNNLNYICTSQKICNKRKFVGGKTNNNISNKSTLYVYGLQSLDIALDKIEGPNKKTGDQALIRKTEGLFDINNGKVKHLSLIKEQENELEKNTLSERNFQTNIFLSSQKDSINKSIYHDKASQSTEKIKISLENFEITNIVSKPSSKSVLKFESLCFDSIISNSKTSPKLRRNYRLKKNSFPFFSFESKDQQLNNKTLKNQTNFSSLKSPPSTQNFSFPLSPSFIEIMKINLEESIKVSDNFFIHSMCFDKFRIYSRIEKINVMKKKISSENIKYCKIKLQKKDNINPIYFVISEKIIIPNNNNEKCNSISKFFHFDEASIYFNDLINKLSERGYSIININLKSLNKIILKSQRSALKEQATSSQQISNEIGNSINDKVFWNEFSIRNILKETELHGLDFKKISFDNIKLNSLSEGLQILFKSFQMIKSHKIKRIHQLFKKFNSVCPFTSLKISKEDSFRSIKNQILRTIELLQILSDVFCYKTSANISLHKKNLYSLLSLSNYQFNEISKSDQLYNPISQYVLFANNENPYYKISIQKLFLLHASPEKQYKPNDQNEQILLFYKLKKMSLIKILIEGINLPNLYIDSDNFVVENGILLTDSALEAIENCFPIYNNDVFLLLCRVLLNEPKPRYETQEIYNFGFNKGTQCIHLIGKIGTKEDDYTIINGLKIPKNLNISCDPNIKYNHNRYVIFKENQIYPEYLIQVKINL